MVDRLSLPGFKFLLQWVEVRAPILYAEGGITRMPPSALAPIQWHKDIFRARVA